MSAEQRVLELEQSLATAIARVEVQRLKLQRLSLENVHLRNVLRTNGIEAGDHADFKVDDACADTEQGECTEQADQPEAQDDESQVIRHDIFVVADGCQVRPLACSNPGLC